jgi:hypothetical protein
MAKLSGDEKPFGEIYEDIYGAEHGRQQTYKQERPGEALALEIAGGLGTGGMGLSKALASQAVKNMGRGAKAATTAGTMAAEGAITGAGAAGPDARGEGALIGGTVGAALPLALAGGGEMVRQVGKRRVAQELGEGEDFIPINVAAPETAVGSFYNDVVGEAFGGGAIRRQAQPLIDRAEAATEKAAAVVDHMKATGTQQIKQSERAIRQGVMDSIEQGNAQFRRQAIDSAAPASMTAEAREKLQQMSPQDARNFLDDHWTTFGFESAKGRQFDVDLDELEGGLKKIYDDAPNLREAVGDVVGDVVGTVRKQGQFRPKRQQMPGVGLTQPTPGGAVKQGTIAGDELMEVRNKYARAANQTTDSAARAAYRRVSEMLDDTITKQLSDDPDALGAYQEDLARWGNQQNLRGALEKSTGKRGDAFTPDDWLGSTKRNRRGKGEGGLQEAATEVQQQGKVLKESISRRIQDNPVRAGVKAKEQVAKTGLKAAKAAEREAKKSGAKPRNIFRQIASTGLLSLPGFVLGGPFGGLTTGAMMARALASPSTQRAMAGQTGAQKAIDSAFKQYDASKLPEYLRRYTPTSAAALQAGQED